MIVTIFQNEHFIAVDKPSGILTISGRDTSSKKQILQEDIQKFLGSKVWVIHRLDYEVSGLILFAKTAEAHRAANFIFENRNVQKTYQAITEGVPPAWKEVTWTSKLLRGKKRTYESPVGKESTTYLQFRGVVEKGLRFKVQPHTGRSHQIRFHLASLGFPILGDHLYGSKCTFMDLQDPLQKDGIALRAVRLDFEESTLTTDFGLPKTLAVSKSLLNDSFTVDSF